MSSELYEIDALDLSVSRKMNLENKISGKKRGGEPFHG